MIADVALRDDDRDAFEHEPIAARVAELVAVADTPVNVALFGPWGSGKSSFYGLIAGSLKTAAPSVAIVRYDAWRYGGSALKRNFISNAASELGLPSTDRAAADFHGGLYEDKKKVKFDPEELLRDRNWVPFVAIAAGALVLAAVASVLTAAAVVAATSTAFDESLREDGLSIFKTVFGTLFALAALAKVIDVVRVEVQQSLPSEDERFTDLFRSLLEKGKHPVTGDKPSRVVFFIDELDRCSKEDVVETLTSLRTFLDQPGCAFVVAADREVIEEALTQLEQATPAREDEPYYSTASAFLDKIFQHQFSLPPLRSSRLTGFARDLVIESGGVWAALRTEGGPPLSDVLYALVPPHVRSPRRVKVLLNNFATTARVLEARGINWRARATEIAKLTVLQTEFPALARDLHLEPRLPSFLLNPPGSPNRRQDELLRRHRLPLHADRAEAVGEPETAPPPSAVPPDALLGPARVNRALVERQRQDLLRYLQSRSAPRIPDPGRDLLYLEAAGQVTGLDDADLSSLIEDEAPNRPHLVIEELAERPVAERVGAARLLGHMSEREFGIERQNVMSALGGAVEELSPDDIDSPAARELLAHVHAYRAEEAALADQLPGFFALAVAAKDRDLVSAVTRDKDFLAVDARLAAAARLLPYLDDDIASPIEDALAQRCLDEPELLLDALRSLPDPSAIRLADRMPAVLSEALSTDTNDRLVDVVGAVSTRANLAPAAARVATAMLERATPGAYAAVRSHFVEISAATPPAVANDLALAALVAAPSTDWALWVDLLQSGGATSDGGPAIAALAEGIGDADPAIQEEASSLLDKLAGKGLINDDTAVDAALASLADALAATDWRTDDGATERQSRLWRFAMEVQTHIPPTASAVAEMLTFDALRSGTWRAGTATRLSRLAVLGPNDTLREVQDSLAQEPALGSPQLAADATAVTESRIRIAADAKRRGLQPAPPKVADVLALAPSATGTTSAAEALSQWFTLDPTPDEVLEVLRALPTAPTSAVTAARTWSLEDGTRGRPALVAAERDEAIGADWFPSLAAGTDDPAGLLEEMAERVRKATAQPQRKTAAAAVAAVPRPSVKEHRIVAVLVEELLVVDPSRVKVEVAADLVAALGGNFAQQKQKLTSAVTALDVAGVVKIEGRPRKIFEDAGLLPKKRKKLFGILG